MSWNPFFTKRKRIIAATMILLLMPVGYLASYPIAYRLLVGSDTNNLRLFSSTSGVWIYREPGSEEFRRAELWQRLQRYGFPPAEWVIDHTPLRHPILAFASMVDIDEQLEDDIYSREFSRHMRLIIASGGLKAFVQLLRRDLGQTPRRVSRMVPTSSPNSDE